MFQWIRLRINKASQYGLFFKKQKVFKTKNKDHHLSNGRDVHKHFVCCIFEKCLQWIYHPAHQINQIHQINIFIIKYIIKYFSYLHISSKVLRHHWIYHNIYHQIHQIYQIHQIHQHVLFYRARLAIIFCNKKIKSNKNNDFSTAKRRVS